MFKSVDYVIAKLEKMVQKIEFGKAIKTVGTITTQQIIMGIIDENTRPAFSHLAHSQPP